MIKTKPTIIEKIFTDFIPPPKFLEMPAAGFYMSDTSVKFLELKRVYGHYAVKRFGEKLLPEGSIVAGQVIGRPAVVNALVSMKNEFGLDLINASLPEEKAYLFKAQIPRVEPEEIRDTIEFRLEENVPIAAAEAVFDYSIIKSADSEKSDHLDVVVSVLPKSVVSFYITLFKDAGLSPISFEIESQAAARAVIKSGDKSVSAVVHIAGTRTGFTIVDSGMVHFTSTTNFGADNLIEALAKFFKTDPKNLFEVMDGQNASSANKERRQMVSSVMESALPLKTEINKMFAYWVTHGSRSSGGQTKIQKIVLCGKGAAIPEFASYLTAATGIACEVGNVWTNAFKVGESIPPINSAESLDYATAIGLALPKDI